jgi:curved DNA-binding protein CbpA
MIDYYEILEVSPKASLEVIRAAYKILLHHYNLEHDSEDQTEAQKLNYLNLAYDALSDHDKREAYDHELNEVRHALNDSVRAHSHDGSVGENVSQRSKANSNQAIGNVNKKGQTSNNASILSRLKWNKWGWIVSILAVVIVLISMVQPDPEKALRGQLAVKSEAEREKVEFEAKLKKTNAEKQKTNPAENKAK